MVTRNFSWRMSSEGATDLIRDMQAIAGSSVEADRALQALVRSSPQLASVNDGVATKMKATAQSMREVEGSTGAAGAAMRNLTIQTSQAVSGLLTGQPILQVLIQQGHQVYDSMLAGGQGFSSLTAAAKGMLAAVGGVPTLITAGVVVALGAMASASETAERRQISLQNALRATRTDYIGLAAAVDRIARDPTTAPSLGADDRLSASQIIASTREFSGSQQILQGLVRTAADLASVLQVDAATAARTLANALKDPAAEAQKLANSGFPGMSQALAYTIKLMSDGGDKSGAFGKVLEVVRRQTAGAADDTTELGRAIRNLEVSLTGESAAGEFFRGIGHEITSLTAQVVQAIADIINAADNARTWMKRLTPPVPDGGPGFLDALKQTFSLALPNMAIPRYLLSGTDNVATSSAGAIGLMQLMPKTAEGLGVDPYDRTENIWGGLKYIQQLASMSIGGKRQFPDESAIAGAYNLGPSRYTPERAAGYNAKIAAADPGGLPKDLASEIEFWGKTLGLPSNLIDLGKRIAMVESGGSHTAIGVPTDLPVPPIPPNGRGDTTADDAFSAYRNSGVLSVRTAENQALQQLLQKGIADASQQGNTDRVAQLSEALADAKAKATDLIGEQQKLARSAVDSIGPLSKEDGALRDLAQIENEFRLKARGKGEELDQQALLKAQLARLTELATAYNDQIVQTDRATASQEAIMHAYDGTQASIDKATNYQKAYSAALRDFIPGSDAFTEAVDRYTAALDRSTAVSHQWAQQRASVDAIGNIFETTFDRVGQAITTNTATSGTALLKLQNIVTAVAGDIAQQLFKLSIINPALNALFGGDRGTIGSAFNTLASGAGKGLLGSAFNYLFGPSNTPSTAYGGVATYAASSNAFAAGGVMTPYGPLPLNRYAWGGIADRPQLAMFGEGRLPEAYVPLQDGRSIPVSMRGGGSGTVVNQGDVHVTVNSSNASPAMIAMMIERGVANGNRQFLAEINRGGIVSKIVGRRAR